MTGATGTMGRAALKEIASRRSHPHFILLARDSKKNRRILAPYLNMEGFGIIWGDLLDKESVKQGVEKADMVLHVGGMVSPNADYFPEKTYETNTGAMRNIVEAVKGLPDLAKCKVVYIGSVAQYGPRNIPDHWTDASGEMHPARFDKYALSKISAERILSESGLPYWASLRLGSILSADLLKKGTDPITFHVPINGVLEWTTDGDCGRLLANLAEDKVPEDFWNRFYNIGSGDTFRITYYDFERRLLEAIGCPPPKKIFKAHWFATDNFHGTWFSDSDILEEYLHFRGSDDVDTHFHKMASTLPWYFSLTPLAPASIIKAFMAPVTRKWPFGTMSWIENSAPEKPESDIKRHAEERVKAFFGSREAWKRLPDWEETEIHNPRREEVPELNDSLKYEFEGNVDLQALKALASDRGGRLLSDKYLGFRTPHEWECAHGHRFSLTPLSAFRGGHWCEECNKEECGI